MRSGGFFGKVFAMAAMMFGIHRHSVATYEAPGAVCQGTSLLGGSVTAATSGLDFGSICYARARNRRAKYFRRHG